MRNFTYLLSLETCGVNFFDPDSDSENLLFSDPDSNSDSEKFLSVDSDSNSEKLRHFFIEN